MLFQPLLTLLIRWEGLGNVCPEPRRVVHLKQVAQLVDHDVIDDLWRRLNESPVQIDVAGAAAASPARALVFHAESLIRYAELVAPMLQTMFKVSFGSLFIPPRQDVVDLVYGW